MPRFQICLVGLCLLLLATACDPATSTSTPSKVLPSASPTWIRAPIPTTTPLPTATPEPEDTGWLALAPGVEWRRLWTETDAGRERLQMIRFDPDQVRLRVVYQSTHPRRVSEWATSLPEALAIVNAGYFTPEMQAIGYIVSDGIPSGYTLGDFAGMLAASPDGRVSLRWLRTWPFNPDEVLAQAVQSFPVLVKPGGVMGFPADADEGQQSRRTVVAQDTAGRLLLLISPNPKFSLHNLAVWLTESDLALDIALNLDGGTSTGLWIRDHDDQVDSFVPVPAVIVFEPMGE